MKTSSILSTSLITLSILFFSACSSKEQTEVVKPKIMESECKVKGEEAPAWVCGSYDEQNRYIAVGSAPMSKLGHNFSRNEALLNARSNLVNRIEIEIKNRAESYMRSSGISENEMVEKVVTQVSKQTASRTINDSKQISYWQSEEDETIYLLVAVDKATINNSVDTEVKEIVDNELQIRNSEDALNKIQ